MGYGYYDLGDGREGGYGVEAVCDEPGCEAQIDHGLGYVCGGEPYGYNEYGCTYYFCSEHLFYGGPKQMCKKCLDEWEAEDEDLASL